MWSTLIIIFLTASVIRASVYQRRVKIVKDLSKKKTAIVSYSELIHCSYIWEGLDVSLQVKIQRKSNLN